MQVEDELPDAIQAILKPRLWYPQANLAGVLLPPHTTPRMQSGWVNAHLWIGRGHFDSALKSQMAHFGMVKLNHADPENLDWRVFPHRKRELFILDLACVCTSDKDFTRQLLALPRLIPLLANAPAAAWRLQHG